MKTKWFKKASLACFMVLFAGTACLQAEENASAQNAPVQTEKKVSEPTLADKYQEEMKQNLKLYHDEDPLFQGKPRTLEDYVRGADTFLIF